jgi:hypothetical protein
MARREASQPQIKLSFDLTLASPDHVTQTLNLCGATGKPAAIARRVSAAHAPWSDGGAVELPRELPMNDDKRPAPMPRSPSLREPSARSVPEERGSCLQS